MSLFTFTGSKSLSPAQLSAIKAVEFVIFLALSAAVAVAYPLLNKNGTLDWTDIAVTGLAVFLLVIIFVIIEYLKQNIQAKLITAEKSGTPTAELQNQLSLVTAIEGSIGLIVAHTQSIATLIPNITSLVNTAQQTATNALQQQALAPIVSASGVITSDSTTPVQHAAQTTYDVSTVSSTTATMPVVSTSTQTL